MKHQFYDVKAKKKITTDVIDAVVFKNGRYAFKGKTADGRSLTALVNEETYKKFKK